MSVVDTWQWNKVKPAEESKAKELAHISLAQMLSEMFDCIISRIEYPTYFWYHEDNGYIEVVECDLYRGRIYMADGDFSEFDWELDESRLYKEI